VVAAEAGEPDALTETLRLAQRFGFFGAAPIEEGIDHAGDFVTAIGSVPPGTRLLDLGSGGGLPGLVIADRLRHAEITLLDRRQKRSDFLRQAAARLGFGHVTVIAADAVVHAKQVADGRWAAYGVVTARSFGPPEPTLRLARRLLGEHGVIVISEPPHVERWNAELLEELDLDSHVIGRVRRFAVR
jgi:16S rRNA (guanine527-N7)-methyltransferase